METKVCTKCKVEKPATEENFYRDRRTETDFLSWCRECFKAYKRSYMVEYYKTHTDKVKLRSRIWREENEERYKKNGKEYTHDKKIAVLFHYGSCCAVCGITDPAFLTIDHINNDGRKDREEIGGGSTFYGWLIRNDFPSGFQVLCFNCNCGRHINGGVCPHDLRG